jgi:hypothetical protein
MINVLHLIYNGTVNDMAEIPLIDPLLFFETIQTATQKGWRVVTLFGYQENGKTGLCGVLAYKVNGQLGITRTVVDLEFPSMARQCPQVQLFEREIAEQFGLIPLGHPWFKPVRFHNPMTDEPGPLQNSDIGVTDYYRVEGESVHEVAVGPVHAGIIEPGHFRFQCHGEEVFHLEISLGYQHRGIEQALIGGPYPQTLRQMETIPGTPPSAMEPPIAW